LANFCTVYTAVLHFRHLRNKISWNIYL